MNTPLITIDKVSKSFTNTGPHVTALQHISFEIHEHEFFVLLGPSGSGKSTLLRIISGLDSQYVGNVTYREQPTPGSIGFVFQHFALLPWLTVAENVEFSTLSHPNSEDRKHRVLHELKRLGLEKFANAYPRDLSGGMRQRIGLARALANDQKIIFMDEPFSELDSFTARTLHEELLRIWQEHNLTIILVTHIIQEAIILADRIGVLTARPGKLEHIIKNPLPRPRNIRTADSFALEDHISNLIKP